MALSSENSLVRLQPANQVRKFIIAGSVVASSVYHWFYVNECILVLDKYVTDCILNIKFISITINDARES